MSKFVVCISGKPNIHGYKRGEFHWNETLKLYVYQKLIFDESQFNEVVAKALDRYHDMSPKVRVVEVAVSQQPVEDLDTPPIATITAAHEVTVEEAEAVMERLAPHRLKKKTGPKPALEATG